MTTCRPSGLGGFGSVGQWKWMDDVRKEDGDEHDGPDDDELSFDGEGSNERAQTYRDGHNVLPAGMNVLWARR